MASCTSRSCAERRLTLIALNARATVAASAVPRTGSCSERLPAAISVAAVAMSRNGRLKWRLRKTPPTSDSASAATPASAKRTRSVSMNCWVSGPVREHQQPAGVATGQVGHQREHAGHVLPPAHARGCRTSGPARPSSPAASLRRRGPLLGPGSWPRPPVDDQRHFTTRQSGQFSGDVVGQAIAGGQGADDVVADAGRHRRPRRTAAARPGPAHRSDGRHVRCAGRRARRSGRRPTCRSSRRCRARRRRPRTRSRNRPASACGARRPRGPSPRDRREP